MVTGLLNQSGLRLFLYCGKDGSATMLRVLVSAFIFLTKVGCGFLLHYKAPDSLTIAMVLLNGVRYIYVKRITCSPKSE